MQREEDRRDRPAAAQYITERRNGEGRRLAAAIGAELSGSMNSVYFRKFTAKTRSPEWIGGSVRAVVDTMADQSRSLCGTGGEEDQFDRLGIESYGIDALAVRHVLIGRLP